MFASGAKILKPGGAEPDVFETSISQALLELEMNSDLKAQLRELYITKAKEIELNGKKVSLFSCLCTLWLCRGHVKKSNVIQIFCLYITHL